jgi:hypothetical protein
MMNFRPIAHGVLTKPNQQFASMSGLGVFVSTAGCAVICAARCYLLHDFCEVVVRARARGSSIVSAHRLANMDRWNQSQPGANDVYSAADKQL